MKIRFLIDTDVTNYRKTSMVVGMPYCDGKCWRDLNAQGGNYDWSLCHNHSIRDEREIEIAVNDLASRYISNPLSHAVVFAGMEPLLSIHQIVAFIIYLRGACRCEDDIVIYTGYNEDEKPVSDFTNLLKTADVSNVIVKFGRYIPGDEEHLDPVLGVKLASKNQYARKIC